MLQKSQAVGSKELDANLTARWLEKSLLFVRLENSFNPRRLGHSLSCHKSMRAYVYIYIYIYTFVFKEYPPANCHVVNANCLSCHVNDVLLFPLEHAPDLS